MSAAFFVFKTNANVNQMKRCWRYCCFCPEGLQEKHRNEYQYMSIPYQCFKGRAHPKMKINSLCTHPCAG